jgi:hypothetical protein
MLYDRRRERWIVRAMDAKEFEDLIDRYGEDLSRWPEGLRQPAAVLLVSSQQARAIIEAARFIREALSAPPVRAPAGLADRIFASVACLKTQSSTAQSSTTQDEATAVSADAGPLR